MKYKIIKLISIIIGITLLWQQVGWGELGQLRPAAVLERSNKTPKLDNINRFENSEDLKDALREAFDNCGLTLQEGRVDQLARRLIEKKPRFGYRSKEQLRLIIRGAGVRGLTKAHQEAIIAFFKVGITRRGVLTFLAGAGTGTAILLGVNYMYSSKGLTPRIKEEIGRRIKETFLPENYGHYELLKRCKIMCGRKVTMLSGEVPFPWYMEYERGQTPDGLYTFGFDCFESAWIIQQWMEELRVKSSVCQARTEYFASHVFVVTSDGTAFSATPDILYVGAKFQDIAKVSRETMKLQYNETKTRVMVGGDGYPRPMKWLPLGENTGVMTSAGIRRGDTAMISFSYAVALIENGKLKGLTHITFDLPTGILPDIQNRLINIPPHNILILLKNANVKISEITRFDPTVSDNMRRSMNNEREQTIDALYYLIRNIDIASIFKTLKFGQKGAQPTAIFSQI